MKVLKTVNSKKCARKFIVFNIYFLKIPIIFDGENWLWKPKIYLIYNPILGNLTAHFSIQGKNVTPNAQKFLNRSCNIGDWFVLYQLRKNTDKQFFCQLLDKLGKDFNPTGQTKVIYTGVLSFGRVWLDLLIRSVRRTQSTVSVKLFLYFNVYKQY